MSLKSILRGVAPLAALAFVAAASGGCDKMHVSINGEEGKKLSELDLTGAPPTEVALLGPDTVRIAQGEALAISVDGDPEVVEEMRFTLKDGKLGILRKGPRVNDDRVATVKVTMPAPKKLMMALCLREMPVPVRLIHEVSGRMIRMKQATNSRC